MNILKVAPTVKGRQLHKFGGSSLADVNAWRQVAGIMARYSNPGDFMVVSAAGNTTNQLIHWLQLSQTDLVAAYQAQQHLYHYQHQLICGLLSPDMAQSAIACLIQEMEGLVGLLKGKMSDAVYAEVVGKGEIWSARLMSALLNSMNMESDWLDARRFLRVGRGVQPRIDEARSRPLLQQLMAVQNNKRVVVTGFIAGNDAGETVLLGRNGSDYSATQTGVLAGVESVTLWSDVAGVYSADPRKVKEAWLLESLSLAEASELARLSVPVLHSRALQPVAASNIDLRLRCSYQPEQGSTRIKRAMVSGNGAKIVTSHDNVCMIELRIAMDTDFLFFLNKINELLEYTQLQSLTTGVHADRHLVQLCYTMEVGSSALAALEAMALPVVSITLHTGLAMVALVGTGIAGHALHSDHFHQHVKDHAVEFISQTAGGISLVAVLRTNQTERLVQDLHQALFSVSLHTRASG